jgi:cyanophycinase
MPEAGPLLAIGGHEDRTGARAILRVVAAHLEGRPLALVTAGSKNPEAYVDGYTSAFADLGVTVLPVPLDAARAAEVLSLAGGVFLTGGKQLRLVSRINEFGMAQGIRSVHAAGGIIAGTSAGASALADCMIVQGAGKSSPAGADLTLGRALDLIGGLIIDQHFAERGRSGRLRAAVALAPDHLGVGLDEDTAIEIRDGTFTVHGSGAVTLIDARGAAARPGEAGRPATIRDATLHILAAGDVYEFAQASPAA